VSVSHGQAANYHIVLYRLLSFIGKQEHFHQFCLPEYNALYAVGSRPIFFEGTCHPHSEGKRKKETSLE
jgi:hypothetical protein